VPILRLEIEKLAPFPIAPSMLDDQERLALISPSSGSLAVPEKLIFVPETKEEPFVGAVILTVGGVLAAVMVMMMEALPGLPPESVTDTVIV